MAVYAAFCVLSSNVIIHQWWDLFCDVNTGEVLSAKEARAMHEADGGRTSSAGRKNEANEDSALAMLPSGLGIAANPALQKSLDLQFIRLVRAGIYAQFGEAWVRNSFNHYTIKHIIDPALGTSQYGNDVDRQQHEDANSLRLSRFRETGTYRRQRALSTERRCVNLQPEAYSSHSPFDSGGVGTNISCHLRRLESWSHMPEEEAERTFVDLVSLVRTDALLRELVSHLPESQGGL